VFGGSTFTGYPTHFERVNLTSGMNQTLAGTTFATPLFQPAPLLIDGVMYVCGGTVNGQSGAASHAIFRYDPVTSLPSQTTSTLPAGVLVRSAAAVPGRGYIFGGVEPGSLAVVDRIVRFVP
jgi:N-acetylneuraminic acid mutarotase